MSFILEALRKSEHERRIEAAPDIMHLPRAVPRAGVPVWAAAAIGALSVALLGVTLFAVLGPRDALWPARPGEAPQAPLPAAQPPRALEAESIESVRSSTSIAATEPGAAGRAPEPASAVAQRIDEPAQQSSTAAPPSTPAPEQSPTAAVQPGRAASAAPTAAVAAAPPAQSGQPPLEVTRLPSYAAIVAEGISLSPLQMQLHVHSATASSRFVVINGSRYVQGDRLAEGPVIEEIAAEGAVLSYRGREFLLTPN